MPINAKDAFSAWEGIDEEAQAVSDDSGFEPVPKGTYAAQLDAAEARVNDKGRPQVDVTYRIIEGDYVGRLIWSQIHFVGTNGMSKGLTGWTKRQCKALADGAGRLADYEAAAYSDLPNLAESLVGATVKIRVNHEEYDGKTRVKASAEEGIDVDMPDDVVDAPF